MILDSQKEITKSKLLKKLLSSVTVDGFQHLRMDDIAKNMAVSRATMYKHFSSKEEVIEGVVRIFIDYLEKLEDPTKEDGEKMFGMWFQKLFEQSVNLVGRITDVFLKDLQVTFPDLYDTLKSTLNKREKMTLEFYQDGKNKGIFNPINEKFILLQDNILLREIMDIKFLLYNQMSIQQALNDYYEFKKIQLFKAEKLSIVDDAIIKPIIEHVVEKFNRSL
ncbi:TetR/AcrR family transcriptional regulator [Paenibacillus psychroresistens]|uniref:TetR/AcrR family transcriptional regulator n=2 Tax=Paenibacillus psychroresistens TaxID=1778678 RepID=A0A6B8RW66_9BACL|nr:TetR/AcrR family transcriptional regulator [Paenibacillus psychroresistens]